MPVMLNCAEIKALVKFNSHFDISLEFLTAVTLPCILVVEYGCLYFRVFIIIGLQFGVIQELQSKPAVSAHLSIWAHLSLCICLVT